MNPLIETLRLELVEKWKNLEAEEPRPDDVSWFAVRVALMFEADQRYRMLLVEMLDSGNTAGLEESKEVIRAADQDHQRRLKLWLAGRSWPSTSQYSSETCEHAWMIALHTDNDLEFQKRVLAAMRPLLASGNVASVHYAALFDRIAIGEGRPQRYGMFYTVENNKELDYPTECPELLQSRRSELGLDDTRFRR